MPRYCSNAKESTTAATATAAMFPVPLSTPAITTGIVPATQARSHHTIVLATGKKIVGREASQPMLAAKPSRPMADATAEDPNVKTSPERTEKTALPARLMRRRR